MGKIAKASDLSRIESSTPNLRPLLTFSKHTPDNQVDQSTVRHVEALEQNSTNPTEESDSMLEQDIAQTANPRSTTDVEGQSSSSNNVLLSPEREERESNDP